MGRRSHLHKKGLTRKNHMGWTGQNRDVLLQHIQVWAVFKENLSNSRLSPPSGTNVSLWEILDPPLACEQCFKYIASLLL